MKIALPRAELQRGLARVQAIVERRNSMPILANALLRAESGQLELIATDLEVGIRSCHQVTVEDPGAVTASARQYTRLAS